MKKCLYILFLSVVGSGSIDAVRKIKGPEHNNKHSLVRSPESSHSHFCLLDSCRSLCTGRFCIPKTEASYKDAMRRMIFCCKQNQNEIAVDILKDIRAFLYRAN